MGQGSIVKNTVKTGFRILGQIGKTAAGGFCIFLLVWFVGIPIGNEVILRGHEKDLFKYDPGSAYTVLDSGSICGKLYGNGNGMEYLAVALVQSEGPLLETRPELGEGIFVVEAGDTAQIQPILEPHNGGSIAHIKEAWENALDANTENCYVIYSLHSAEYGSLWTWDLRGH